jgi:hypothetical protein
MLMISWLVDLKIDSDDPAVYMSTTSRIYSATDIAAAITFVLHTLR